MDITGVAALDSNIAHHLVHTVNTLKLMGATAIVTGISPEIAHTLVTLGVDISKINTVGDLQGGIELANQLLGYRLATTEPEKGAESAQPKQAMNDPGSNAKKDSHSSQHPVRA